MIFWLAAGALVIGAGLFMVRGLGSGVVQSDAADLGVYRDQLDEVDRDLTRGVLGQDEAERVRAEIGRRVLAADKDGAVSGGALSRGGMMGAAGFVALMLAGSVFLYGELGVPGYGDQPLSARVGDAEERRATRPSQSEAEAAVPVSVPVDADPRHVALVEELRKVVADRPDDIQGLTLLARNEAILGNLPAARKAQQQIVALNGPGASLDDLTMLVDLMVFAAGGLVTPEADQVLAAILAQDDANGAARYYVGLMHAQTGRPDLAFGLWRPLLEAGPADAPWVAPIMASISDLAAMSGVDYTPPSPTSLPGPTSQDVAAAMDMTDADRVAMVESMVEGLAERLASEGGSPEEWARLIRALGVLKQNERAAAIWNEAQTTFADVPEGLEVIRKSAVAAGIAK